MFQFKRTTPVLIILILTAFLAACTSSNQQAASQQPSPQTTAQPQEAPKPKQALTFGLMPAVDAIALTIAQEKGYFEKYGVDVKLQIFNSPKDRDAAFQAGQLDGISTDQVAVALYQNGGIDVKITGVTDGDFLLIAGKDSGIKSISDIKGKSIGISEKSVIEYGLDRILGANSLKPEDVKKTVIPAIPARLEMLKNNKLDIALLPEPFATFAQKDGGIVIGKASDLGLSPAVSAFTQKSIDTKPEEIKAFYKAYNDAVQYLNSAPVSEYEDLVIKTVGYPEDMKGKLELGKYRVNQLPKEKELQDSISWAASKGLCKDTLTPKDMMNDIAVK